MKMFTAQLNDSGYIHIPADKMLLEDNCIRVYRGDQLVAFIDTSIVLSAHLSEAKVRANE